MITLGQAETATGGTWLRQPFPADTPVRGGAFDTRDLKGTELFFALPGERADGHDFLPGLAGTSVKLAIVAKPVAIPGFGGAILQVPDTLRALAHMARSVVDAYGPKDVLAKPSVDQTSSRSDRYQSLAKPGVRKGTRTLP